MTKIMSITITRPFTVAGVAEFVEAAAAVGAIDCLYVSTEHSGPVLSTSTDSAAPAPAAETPAPASAAGKAKGKKDKETAALAGPPADAASAEQQATASAPTPSPAADSATPSAPDANATSVVSLTTIRAAVAKQIVANADNRGKIEALVAKAVPAGGEARLSNILPGALPAFLAAVEAL